VRFFRLLFNEMNFVPNFLTLNIKVTYKKGRLYSVTLELSVFS